MFLAYFLVCLCGQCCFLAETIEKSISSIRFLITNIAAGSVIGKGGTTINEFQTQSGAKIQLSRNHEYFPGTSDRIISLSGAVKEVLTAFHLILSKIISEVKSFINSSRGAHVHLALLLILCQFLLLRFGNRVRKITARI